MFTALLDTCVLWPSLQRDFLLSLGVEGLYRPVWSDAILDELEYHEAKKLQKKGAAPEAAELRAAYLVGRMREHFDDALVAGWEGLEGTYGLPDPGDEHVVAAAVVGGAGAIVTLNLKDFPVSKIPEAVQILPPAIFLLDTVSLDPRRAVKAIHQISERTGKRGAKLSPEDVLDALAVRYGLNEVVGLLRDYI